MAAVVTELGILSMRVLQSVDDGEELSFWSDTSEVAYLILGENGNAIEIKKLEVKPRFRLKEIGSNLINSLAMGAQRRSISELQLQSVPAALAFWKSVGAEVGAENDRGLFDCRITLR